MRLDLFHTTDLHGSILSKITGFILQNTNRVLLSQLLYEFNINHRKIYEISLPWNNAAPSIYGMDLLIPNHRAEAIGFHTILKKAAVLALGTDFAEVQRFKTEFSGGGIRGKVKIAVFGIYESGIGENGMAVMSATVPVGPGSAIPNPIRGLRAPIEIIVHEKFVAFEDPFHRRNRLIGPEDV